MEKKNFNYKEKKKIFCAEKNFDGLLPILWTRDAGAGALGWALG